MIRKLGACLLGVIVCICLLNAQAQNRTRTQVQPKKYVLLLVLIADAQPVQYLRVIQESKLSYPNVGYKSLKSSALKYQLKQIRDGSIIEYFPSCLQTGGEPTSGELDAFKALCKQEHLKFIIYPSG